MEEEIKEICTPGWLVDSLNPDDEKTWYIMRTLPRLVEHKIMKKHALPNGDRVTIVSGKFCFKPDTEGNIVIQLCVNYKLDSDEKNSYKFCPGRVIVEATHKPKE